VLLAFVFKMRSNLFTDVASFSHFIPFGEDGKKTKEGVNWERNLGKAG
jgi:hypothetical protein